MPLNVMDAHFRSFTRHVLPKLLEQRIAVLGMKPLCDGHVLRSNTLTAIECLHYALTLPASVIITGCESLQRLDQAIEAVDTFAPMSEAQIAALLARTRDQAATGEYEPFKTTEMFDGTAHTPAWMGESRMI
jgi:hypothetical protein